MSEGSIESQKQKVSVSSLRKDCLSNLRFPSPDTNINEKPKTHLLACMAEFIDEKPDIKSQEIDEYCCFDRMKKIIEKRKNCSQGDRNRSKDSGGLKQTQKLTKFIQIQAKMKKMQQNLMKYSAGSGKNDTSANNNELLYQSSLTNMFLTAPVEQRWKDKIVTDNCSGKQKSQGLPGRFEMKKKIREQGYHQYLEWQKKKIIDNENDIRQFVQTEIEEKVKNMLEQRDIKYNELLKNEKNLQRLIMQKNLQIQNLKAKQQNLTKCLKQLQCFKQRFSEQNTLKTKQKQLQLQNFNAQFLETFPNESIKSLKQYIDSLTDKCLRKFNEVECKNLEKWKQEKTDMNDKIHRLENTIYKFRTTQNQLLNNLKQFRNQQSAATIEMDTLLKKQIQLEKLQRKILELYNDWYGKVPDSSKEIMRSVGYLQGSYEYEKMLEYIVVFENKFSNNSKVNDYLIKILRGIQRIRKILFPKTSSNSDQRKQVMDPLFILDRLQKYMKSKVYQIHKQSNCAPKGTRASFVIEQEFLRSVDQNVEPVVQGGGQSQKLMSELVKKHNSLSTTPKTINSSKMRLASKNKHASNHINKMTIFTNK